MGDVCQISVLINKLLNNSIDLFTNPSWQQLVLMLAVIFILVFRKNIGRFIDRIIKIGKDGIGLAEAKQPVPLLLKNKFPAEKSEYFTIKKDREDIEKLCKSERNESKKTTDLINWVANLQFRLVCERIYHLIFGTQIQLLKKLQENENPGLSQYEVEAYFKIVKKHHEFSVKITGILTVIYTF